MPLGKTFNIVDMIIVVAFVLEKMINIIHKIFYMNAYISYKNVLVQKKKIFQKELALIKQFYQNNVCFIIISISKVLNLNSSHMFVINVRMY